jgi:hypothetical protein
LIACRAAKWHRRRLPGTSRHCADKSTQVFGIRKWFARQQIKDIAPTADHQLGLEREPLHELRPDGPLSHSPWNNEGSGRPNVDYAQVSEFLGQQARPKGLVPSDIHASYEHD